MQPNADLSVGGAIPARSTAVGAGPPVSYDQFDRRSVCGQKGLDEGQSEQS